MQELVEVVGRATGVVLMAPPVEHAEAAASISTLLSSLKPKQKVGSTPCQPGLDCSDHVSHDCPCKHKLVLRSTCALAALCKAGPWRLCVCWTFNHVLCV